MESTVGILSSKEFVKCRDLETPEKCAQTGLVRFLRKGDNFGRCKTVAE
jgi:hypothetical protein